MVRGKGEANQLDWVQLLSIYLAPQILGLRGFTSPSAQTVILPGDHFFADMVRYRFTSPARGDLGRVIGLEGEDFEIRDKKVYVDSRPLADPWGPV